MIRSGRKNQLFRSRRYQKRITKEDVEELEGNQSDFLEEEEKDCLEHSSTEELETGKAGDSMEDGDFKIWITSEKV